MYRNNGVYIALVLVIGVLIGWWLANMPLHQLDDAARIRLDDLGANFGTSGLLVAFILLLFFLVITR